MYDCFLAHALIIVMLFFCNARVLYIKNSRIDSFAAFSPISLIISILLFYCFGFSVLNLAVFILSLLVFFNNFRAVLRLSSRLIIDAYSGVFIAFSIFFMILTIGLGVIIFLTRPVRYSLRDFDTIKTEYSLTGNLANLRLRDNMFSRERFSGNLSVYEPDTNDSIALELYSKNPVLIFAPSIRASVQNYEPYFLFLAQKGYKVLSADFYTQDFNFISYDTESLSKKALLESKFYRRFSILHLERTNPEKAAKILEEDKILTPRKYAALTKLALELYGDDTKVFYITDGLDFDSIYSVITEFNTEPYKNAKGFFSMNRVDEYKTSGYGFIEQTDVFLANGMKINRENKFFIPRYVAGKTIKYIGDNYDAD